MRQVRYQSHTELYISEATNCCSPKKTTAFSQGVCPKNAQFHLRTAGQRRNRIQTTEGLLIKHILIILIE